VRDARHPSEAGDFSDEPPHGGDLSKLGLKRAADEAAATYAPAWELEQEGVDDIVMPMVPIGPFSPEACTAFAQGLDDQSLGRALTLFEQLEVDGRVETQRLAETLAIPAAGLWGAVTNPIKRQVDSLGLPLPYEVIPGIGDHESWVDSVHCAPALVLALRAEMRVRLQPLNTSDVTSRPATEAAAPDPGVGRQATKYEGLTARLESLEKGERRLGLEQIEGIIGFELPPKAWADAEWWSNDSSLPYLRHAEAWLSVGWRAFPDLEARVIVFQFGSSDDHEPSSERSRGRFGRLAKSLFGSRPNGTASEAAYGKRVSEEFASGLSDAVLARAECLFRTLAKHGEVASGELARLLGSETSRLGGQLATPLRRRAHVLALDPPYQIAISRQTGARVWRPASGAEAHLPRALSRELRSR